MEIPSAEFITAPEIQVGREVLLELPRQTYKTPEEKRAYELQISTRIRPYLFLHSEDLELEIAQAQDLDVADYATMFDLTWAKHIGACREIDAFFTERVATDYPQWCEGEWQLVSLLLKEAIDTDKDKNIFSAGVKQKIELETKQLADKYGWTDEDIDLCITPSTPTFHTMYNLDHLRFSTLDIDSDAYRQEAARLSELYHHGDRGLLEIRLQHMGTSSLPPEIRQVVIDQTEHRITQSGSDKARFLAEYPEAEAVDRLLVFDNWQEYRYVYAQAGYPDLHLREAIVRQAYVLGLVEDQDMEALSISKEEIFDIINAAIEITNRDYHLETKGYIQTTLSCGVCCAMTIAHERIEHTQKNEVELWQRAGAPYNFPGGISLILMELGYEVEYIRDRTEHFTPGKYPIHDIDINPSTRDTAEQYVALHETAENYGMKCTVGDINFSTVLDALKDGNAVIIGIDSPLLGVLHWIAAKGYRNGNGEDPMLEIDNPMDGLQYMSQRDFDNVIDTYMGRRLIVVSKNRKAQ